MATNYAPARHYFIDSAARIAIVLFFDCNKSVIHQPLIFIL